MKINSMRRVRHAGLLASVFAVVALGGSTYAAMRWQGSDGAANYGGITKLANGNTRFWVQVKGHDCSDEQGKQWFDIKAGSSITPAQISDMVAGTCENLDMSAIFPGVAIGGTLPKGITYEQQNAYERAMNSTELNTQYYMSGGIVQAITKTSLSISIIDMGTHTFPIESSATIFKDGEPYQLSNIKPGQPVVLVLQARGTFRQAQRESILPNSSVYGIELTHHEPYNLAAEGKQFTRLVPNPAIHGPSGKGDPAVLTFWQNPSHLIEEHPLQ